MNLQICFVNDSGSDKDSDADDSKTETSLDTPLSPMVSPDAHLWTLKPTQGYYSISAEFKKQRKHSVKVRKYKELIV